MHGPAFDGVIARKMAVCFLMALKHAWCSPGRVSYVKEGIVMDIAFHFPYFNVSQGGHLDEYLLFPSSSHLLLDA